MVPSLEMKACKCTTPETRACLASGGYCGFGPSINIAAWTFPPITTRFGGGGGPSFFAGGGGGGGGAIALVWVRMLPSTPPTWPPTLPPGTPPTTPPIPEAAGGNSSSLITAISFGIALGVVSFPASNWRGITLTCLITGAAAGGGGGGGGGGGATSNACRLAAPNCSYQIIGMITAKQRRPT